MCDRSQDADRKEQLRGWTRRVRWHKRCLQQSIGECKRKGKIEERGEGGERNAGKEELEQQSYLSFIKRAERDLKTLIHSTGLLAATSSREPSLDAEMNLPDRGVGASKSKTKSGMGEGLTERATWRPSRRPVADVGRIVQRTDIMKEEGNSIPEKREKRKQ